MSNNVETIDFGKERRDTERMMLGLLGIVEKQHAELIKDPVRLYRRAVDEIVALRKFQRDLQEAFHIPIGPTDLGADRPTLRPQPVTIDHVDYDRFKRVEALIQRGPIRPCDTRPSEAAAESDTEDQH